MTRNKTPGNPSRNKNREIKAAPPLSPAGAAPAERLKQGDARPPFITPDMGCWQEQEKFRQLFEMMPDAIFFIDSETGRILEANRAASELYGYTQSELKSLRNVDLSAEPNATRNATEEQLVTVPRRYHKRKDGTVFTVEITGSHFVWHCRKVHFAVIREIGWRVKIEEELKESRLRIEQALNGADLGTWDLDITTGAVVYDQRLTEMLGYKLEEFKPDISAWQALLHPDDYDYCLKTLQDHLDGKTEHYETEHRLKHKSGAWSWILSRGKVVSRDPEGKPLRACGTHLDITDRKRAEAELRDSQDRLMTIIDQAPAMIDSYDKTGKCHIWNRECVKRLGWTRDEINEHGNPLRLLFSDKIERRRLYESYMRADGRFREYTLRAKDGSYRRQLWADFRLPNGEIISIGHDITERKQAEEERAAIEARLRQTQKMDALGTLAGGIAHNFNNILAAVMGYSERGLQKAHQGKPTFQEMEKILQASDRAKKLVEQILAFSRNVEPKLVQLDLNREVETAMELVKQTLPPMIRIEMDLSRERSLVKMDSGQVLQVLMNLCSNAADSMPDGGRLRISTSQANAPGEPCATCGELITGDYAVLEVSDTGHGMEAETLDKIFNPFFTTKEVGKGTGLGLSTVYGVVREHEGHVQVHSAAGGGASFRLYLPLDQTAHNEKAVPRASGGDPLPGKESILLVDDEEAIVELGSELLKMMGYTVFQAYSGEDALEFYRGASGKVDLVILDLGMPGMGGQTCLKRLLEIDPEQKVLIASGYFEQDFPDAKGPGGAAGFIAKPFKRKELLEKVRSVLDS